MSIQVITPEGSTITVATGFTAGAAYTLPTATDTVLGGVKIGAGVTIAAGVISVSTNFAPASGISPSAITGTAVVVADLADYAPLSILPPFGEIASHSSSEFAPASLSSGANTIATLGTITAGTWHGSAIADSYISSAATWNAKQSAISFGTGVQTALGVNFGNAGALARFSDITGTNSGTNTGDQDLSALATKAYADALVIGLVDDRGNFDASVNTFPTTGGSGTAGAVLKGDLWTISVLAASGPLNGYPVGCLIRAKQDAPGQTAGNWAITEVGFGYSPENAANKSTSVAADQASDTKYPSVKSLYDWATGLFATIASLAGYVPTTRTVNGSALSADVTIAAITGNAGTATKLATARNIDGQAFDGLVNISVIAPATVAAPSKTTPVDADSFPIQDSAASGVLKQVTFGEILAATITGSSATTGVVEIGTLVLAAGTWDLCVDCIMKNNDAASVDMAIYYAVKSGSATGGLAKVHYRASAGSSAMSTRSSAVGNNDAQYTSCAASGYTAETYFNRGYVTTGCTLAISLQNSASRTVASDATVYVTAARRA